MLSYVNPLPSVIVDTYPNASTLKCQALSAELLLRKPIRVSFGVLSLLQTQRERKILITLRPLILLEFNTEQVIKTATK